MIASHKPPQGDLFLTDSGAPPARVASFRGDTSLCIERMDGDLPALLGCDADELLDHGWHPFLHHEDWDVVERMGLELAARTTAQYEVRVVSRSGDRLYVAVRTILVFDRPRVAPAPSLSGVIDLLHRESPRRYVDLGRR